MQVTKIVEVYCNPTVKCFSPEYSDNALRKPLERLGIPEDWLFEGEEGPSKADFVIIPFNHEKARLLAEHIRKFRYFDVTVRPYTTKRARELSTSLKVANGLLYPK